jgi:hypothetical protein
MMFKASGGVIKRKLIYELIKTRRCLLLLETVPKEIYKRKLHTLLVLKLLLLFETPVSHASRPPNKWGYQIDHLLKGDKVF